MSKIVFTHEVVFFKPVSYPSGIGILAEDFGNLVIKSSHSSNPFLPFYIEYPECYVGYDRQDTHYVNSRANKLRRRGYNPILGTLYKLIMTSPTDKYVCRGLSFVSADEPAINLKRGVAIARKRAINKMKNLINRQQKRVDGYMVLMEHGVIPLPKGMNFEKFKKYVRDTKAVRYESRAERERLENEIQTIISRYIAKYGKLPKYIYKGF